MTCKILITRNARPRTNTFLSSRELVASLSRSGRYYMLESFALLIVPLVSLMRSRLCRGSDSLLALTGCLRLTNYRYPVLALFSFVRLDAPLSFRPRYLAR